MEREHIIEKILREKVIAIARGLTAEQAVKAATALYDGGIRLMEITFGKASDEETGSIIAGAVRAMDGKMVIGAGTVLTERQAEITKANGGAFIISPDTNVSVIRRTVELGMVSIPGAMTPTEAVTAHHNGADLVKIFPAAALGADYIEAICAPLGKLRLMAVGGISEKNLAQFLAAGCVGVGIGGSLVSRQRIDAGDYAALTETAKQVVAATRG